MASSSDANTNYPRVSFRRTNRKEIGQTNWTYELKSSLYSCYVRAEPNKPHYMKRLKSLWDVEHPEFNHLTSKNLRDKAAWIIKKKRPWRT